MSTSTALWGGLMIKGNVCNVESVERQYITVYYFIVCKTKIILGICFLQFG